MATTIIRVAGRARRANVHGETIHREDVVYVPSERQVFRIMDTDNHFCYRRTKGTYGSTLMCTCGFAAGIFQYQNYRHIQESNEGRLLCCIHLIQYGKHADGST